MGAARWVSSMADVYGVGNGVEIYRLVVCTTREAHT